jgi:hypothetical protein
MWQMRRPCIRLTESRPVRRRVGGPAIAPLQNDRFLVDQRCSSVIKLKNAWF